MEEHQTTWPKIWPNEMDDTPIKSSKNDDNVY